MSASGQQATGLRSAAHPVAQAYSPALFRALVLDQAGCVLDHLLHENKHATTRVDVHGM